MIIHEEDKKCDVCESSNASRCVARHFKVRRMQGDNGGYSEQGVTISVGQSTYNGQPWSKPELSVQFYGAVTPEDWEEIHAIGVELFAEFSRNWPA